MNINAHDISRLISKVSIGSSDDCWEWDAGKSSAGYGRFSMIVNEKKNLYSPHRLMYELFCGKIPSSFFVCHHCDNPSCVNPRHLFVGTRSDNMKDAYKKGRVKAIVNSRQFNSGELHPNSKLTNVQVNEIKSRLSAGERQIDIAKDYDVSKYAINKIARGYTWKTHGAALDD